MAIESIYPTVEPSLNMVFARDSVDPRITFTRASRATRVNSKGYIEKVGNDVPRIDYNPVTLACKGLLIEEQRVNLLSYSSRFDKWTGPGIVVTDYSTLNPDGTVGAQYVTVSDKTMYFDANGALAVTLSFYTKERLHAFASVQLYHNTSLGEAGDGGTYQLYLNGTMSTPTYTNGSGVTITLSNMVSQPVGNGWYRISVLATASVAWTANSRIDIEGISSQNYVYGFQIEISNFPSSYIPSVDVFIGRTSPGTYIGSDGLIKTAASGVARYNYNPLDLTVAPQLLLEPARTNLCLQSSSFADAPWISMVPDLTNVLAPDGSNTAKQFTVTGGTLWAGYQTITCTADTTYAWSIYVKLGTLPTSEYKFAIRDDSNGAFIIGDLNPSQTVTSSAWVRVTCIFTTPAGCTLVRPYFCRTTPVTGGTFYVWGAQLEEGAYPTSYIPTTTTAVPRSADTSTSSQVTRLADSASMLGTNFSSWYRQGEGTLFAEVDSIATTLSNYPTCFELTDGTSNNIVNMSTNILYNARVVMRSEGVAQVDMYSGTTIAGIPPDNVIKYDFGYASNSSAASRLGEPSAVDTVCIVPSSLTQARIGFSSFLSPWNGHIRRLTYYPTRLTNSQLQSITT